MTLTPQIHNDIYQVTLDVIAGHATLGQGAATLVRMHRLNPNSARMSIRSLRHLIQGERYRRAMTIGATDHFLDKIRQQTGSAGLRRALDGLSAHIAYRNQGGVKVPGLEDVLAKHLRLV